MDRHYAQLDADGRCIAIVSPGGGRVIEGENIIEIPAPELEYLGRKHEGGAWQDQPAT